MRAALAEIGRTPVVVPVHEQNLASIAVLTRCGFTRLGIAGLEPDNPAHTRRHVVLANGTGRRIGSATGRASAAPPPCRPYGIR